MNTVKLRIQKIHWLLLAGLALFIVFYLRWLDIATLQLYTVDDYGFHGVMRRMYSAIINADLFKLFRYNFYSYGFSFFFLNELLCFPFLAAGWTEAVIFIPRMVSAFFALLGMLYVYKTARLYMEENTS